MMKYFMEAWDDCDGLAPLEKLIWICACDSGSSQDCNWPVQKWVEWTGAEASDVIVALQSLFGSGRIIQLDLSQNGEVYLRTKFAVEIEDEMARRSPRDPNAYRKAPITSGLRRRVLARDGHQCVYCGTDEALTIDHIYPERLGGSTTEDNLCAACKSCNSSKGTKTLEEWQGGLS